MWRQGYRSLQTRQKIKTLEMMGPVPYFICLHCLKNDQGKLLVGNFRIVADDALEFIRYRFPNARVIWSYILNVFISAILQTYAQWENLANVLIPMYLPWFCNPGEGCNFPSHRHKPWSCFVSVEWGTYVAS